MVMKLRTYQIQEITAGRSHTGYIIPAGARKLCRWTGVIIECSESIFRAIGGINGIDKVSARDRGFDKRDIKERVRIYNTIKYNSVIFSSKKIIAGAKNIHHNAHLAVTPYKLW